MQTYVITRANGWANVDELKAAAARSSQVGNEEMPDKVRWIRSYVTTHEGGRLGTVCIYQATDPEAIREHARRVGMPADGITPSSTPSSFARTPPTDAPGARSAPSAKSCGAGASHFTKGTHMALTAPSGFDVSELREAIRTTYERVAVDPSGAFHFHRGAAYAVELLGYDAAELASLPQEATSRFAGVGNPLAIGPIHPGETVLDHACGAGTDLLLAARRVGPRGRVIGVDVTLGMRQVAARALETAGFGTHAVVRAGSYEDLPILSSSIDVVISNGVINLAPEKRRVFQEIWRVLRPGGRLYLADVVVARELKLEARQRPELWAACIAGALTEPELVSACLDLGFTDVRPLTRFRCFEGTTAEDKVSRDLNVQGMNLFARKPPG